ncbi:Copper-transporting ATPase RAN1 [Zea mays]|uniref:Copper-transporting ATPase RAN1 n=1 Tax=Zea mays TaxID=4577 RepID=A0A1D6P5M7_MAIZE|nr:Copper-transporting ATPase RAN1 [Zea mays]
MTSNGSLKAHVQNPYTRGASNDAQEASKMLNLLRSSLFLSIPVFFIRMVCPSIPFLSTLLSMHCGPFLMGDLLKWILKGNMLVRGRLMHGWSNLVMS